MVIPKKTIIFQDSKGGGGRSNCLILYKCLSIGVWSGSPVSPLDPHMLMVEFIT